MATLHTKLELTSEQIGKLYRLSDKFDVDYNQLATSIMVHWLEMDDEKSLMAEYEALYKGKRNE